MSVITFENAKTVQSLLNSVARDKPAVGCLVRVTRGKHTGKIGRVKRHMLSRFKDPFRYGNEMSRAMTQARGRSGFCVLIETPDEDTFWADADLTMVCLED